jgi:hypothetical protein
VDTRRRASSRVRRGARPGAGPPGARGVGGPGCVVGVRRTGGAGPGCRSRWWRRIAPGGRSSTGAWRTSGGPAAAPSADHAWSPAADEGKLAGCARVLGHPQARRTSGLAVAEQAAHHGGYGVRALIRPTAIRSPELDLERSTCRHLTHRQRCPYHIYNVIDRRRGVVQLRSTRIDRTGRIGFGPRASATDGRRQLRAELGSRCRPRAYAASGSPRSFPVHRRCR